MMLSRVDSRIVLLLAGRYLTVYQVFLWCAMVCYVVELKVNQECWFRIDV